MSIKHPKVTVLLLLIQFSHTKHYSMYKFIYSRIFWRLLTTHSPSVCSMFNDMVQYFLMLFTGVTIMTSVS